MRILKRLILGFVIFVMLFVALFVLIIGPWPTYKTSGWQTASYYTNAVSSIKENVAKSEITDKPGQLKVGWGKSVMTPDIGMPLGGYGARIGKNGGHPNGNISTGVRDQLYATAIAFNDGVDTAVIVGSDMLIVPPNVAEMVRKEVGERTPLTPNNILFNASHTHCGPGGFGPGVAAYFTGGGYRPEIPVMIAKAFTDAIVQAYENMKPAKVANGEVLAPEYIRNRTRKAPVDAELKYLVAEQEDGKRCYVFRYSAHPTTFGDDQMEFSAEFPGEAKKFIQDKTGAEAIYLGGATGSMGPNAPEAPTADERVMKMGQALGQLVLDDTIQKPLQFKDHLDVVSVGVSVEMPQLQLRPIETSPNLRVSPFARFIVGLPVDEWVQGVRIGDIMFAGMPYDFSGEVSIQWAAWGKAKGVDIWVTSFSGAYAGYLSPDKYYSELPLDYETGLMSWFGPDQEAHFTALFQNLFDALGAKPLTPPAAAASAGLPANG